MGGVWFLLCPCNQVAKGCGPARVKGVMGKKQAWVSHTEETKWLADIHSKYGLSLKTPAYSLISPFISGARKKASQSQRQNWWLRDCGYLTNKRFIDSEWNAVCKLRSLCEQAGEFKLVLDVQDRPFCFGTCREWAQQRFIVEGFECTDGIKYSQMVRLRTWAVRSKYSQRMNCFILLNQVQ